MKKVFILIVFGLMLTSLNLQAQNKNIFSIQYDVAYSGGDLNEYISKPSFRGSSFQYRYLINENLSVGFDAAWNVFFEKKEYDTYTFGTHSLSGIQYRSQNQVPILFSSDYMIITDKKFKPYVGFGLGTIYSKRSTDMGIWSVLQEDWQFAIKPEGGVMAAISERAHIKMSVKYYIGFETDNMAAQNYFTISGGMAFKF
jgi:opacity protein-like surface antigen